MKNREPVGMCRGIQETQLSVLGQSSGVRCAGSWEGVFQERGHIYNESPVADSC